MLKKWLVVLSTILLAMLVLEIGYLIFFKPSSLGKIEENPGKAINANVIGFLRNFDDRSTLYSAVVSTNFRGRVFEVVDKPGAYQGVVYDKRIDLEPLDESKKQFITSIFFRKTDLPALNVYDRVIGNIKKKIKFTDLKKGDTVSIDSVIDMKKDPLYNRIKIDIIKQ